jgi:SAM-dependent methyltransferase
LEKELEGFKTILDLGCGANKHVRYDVYSIGVDMFERSIQKSMRQNIHDEYFCMDVDVLDAETKFSRKSFDGVIAIDLIEHLEKQDGLRLLAIMERIAKKVVVVSTPNGFLSQNAYEDNVWQIHKSGWVTEEMRKRGYKVMGINGWKPLRGEMGRIRFTPEKIMEWISMLTEILVRNIPEKAFELLSVKHI